MKKNNINSIDVADKKRLELEEELRQAKEKAEEASRVKSDFIANMEHDLRNPCAGISAMAEELESNESDATKKQILGEISQAAKFLLDQLNSILDFNHIETGRIPIVNKRFSLCNIIQNTLATGQLIAREKNLSFSCTIDKRIPSLLLGDKYRISRILLNLMSNALKFTTQGFIKIRATQIKKTRKDIVVQIIVEDSGMGIAEDKQALVFEKFYRVARANKSAVYVGSGLGLAIVKQFVEDVGGEIEVSSEIGCGSTFTCTLPLKISLLSEKACAKKSKIKGLSMLQDDNTHQAKPIKANLKILIVEDDALSRQVAQTIFEKTISGCTIKIAENGEKALNLVKKNRYDLILTDIGLPGINGYELATRIHKLLPRKNRIPIIALTAHKGKTVAKMVRQHKIKTFITKPINANGIHTILTKFFPHLLPPAENKKSLKAIKAKEELTSKKSQQTHSAPSKAITDAIDFDLAKQQLNLEKKDLLPLLKILIKSLPETKKNINKAILRRNAPQLAKIVHKLLSGASYCGVYHLKTIAENLESAAQHKKGWQTIKNLTQKLYQAIDAVIEQATINFNISLS